jgi:hypothetical protein
MHGPGPRPGSAEGPAAPGPWHLCFPRTGVALGVMSEPIPPEGIARYVVAQAVWAPSVTPTTSCSPPAAMMSAQTTAEPRPRAADEPWVRWQELTKSECFELLANEHLGRLADYSRFRERLEQNLSELGRLLQQPGFGGGPGHCRRRARTVPRRPRGPSAANERGCPRLGGRSPDHRRAQPRRRSRPESKVRDLQHLRT